jgi:hypothetical protein
METQNLKQILKSATNKQSKKFDENKNKQNKKNKEVRECREKH